MLQHMASKNANVLDLFYYIYTQRRIKCVITIIVFFPIINELHISEDDTQ